jgi:hypothetical protein
MTMTGGSRNIRATAVPVVCLDITTERSIVEEISHYDLLCEFDDFFDDPGDRYDDYLPLE